MQDKNYSKIAFVAGTLGKGGAERQLFYLTTSLAKQQYQVTVYCLNKGEFYESKLQENGVEVIYFGADKSKGKRINNLYRLLKIARPSLVYSFHFYTNTYAAIAGKLLGIKVIGSIRNDGVSEKDANGKMSWLHYSLPNYIIANSGHGAANCEKIFYKKKIIVLGNVIDTDSFQFSKKNISPQTQVRLVMVGRFEQQKQPWLFPVLIKKLTDAGLNVAGEMYGDGSLKNATAALVKNEFFGYNISIHDTHPQIQEVYKNAHWLCSLSKHEGTPNVVLEAMASGVAIAALNYPGIKILIENAQCGLVEDNVESLCSAIINNSQVVTYEKITENANQKILNEYSIVNLVKRFEKIIDKM